MWAVGAAFGQSVALWERHPALPSVPARLLSPGPGFDLREQARGARDRAQPPRPRPLVIPGRRSWEEQARYAVLGVDPAPVDLPAYRRWLGEDATEVHRYAVLGEWADWQRRVAELCAVDPRAELAGVLRDRPELRDEPTGGGLGRGLDAWGARMLVDSLAARAQLINALQGEQFADAAALVTRYPDDPEFIAAEVSLALQVPESTASSLICTAVQLAGALPATLAAVRSGVLRADIAEVIVGATTVVTDPAVASAIENRVLPHVAWKSRESVRRLVVREILRLDPDGADARHKVARRARCVSKWGDADGMGWLKLHATAQDIAAVWDAVTGLAAAAKTPNCDTTLDQRRADAMCDVFRSVLDDGFFGTTKLPNQHGRRPHVEVLVPHDVLHPAAAAPAGPAGKPRPAPADPSTCAMADRPGDSSASTPATCADAQPADVCEIVGYGPVARSQALEIAAAGLWRRLICDSRSGMLLDYGRTRYEPPEALKHFVVTRDQLCRFPGCSQPAWRAQIDHVLPFSAGGLTNEVNLTALCHHHHRAKDGGGFRIRINADRSTTWTSPLGRTATIPPHRLMSPRPAEQGAPQRSSPRRRPAIDSSADPPPF